MLIRSRYISKSCVFQRCILITTLLYLLVTQVSCKKYLEVKPPITEITAESVYNLDATAAAVFTGMYTNLSRGSFATGSLSISLLSGLSADEFVLSEAVSKTDKLAYYYRNELFSSPVGNPGTEFWAGFYRNIYACNEAIEKIKESTDLTPAVRQQLLGEAFFMRAFNFFYLVNLYGDVPLPVITDYKINSHLSRTPASEVYLQIIQDLTDAEEHLADHYVAADAVTHTTERVRPTKWAAKALLARVYLYTGDYASAEATATDLINNTGLYNLVTDLNEIFLANSMEAIWQLQPVNTGWNTEDARVFVINAAPSISKPVSLSLSLYNEFEVGDQRKSEWIKDTIMGSRYLPYPYKYKNAKRNLPVTEYLMVFRLGEQYLIRAEARTHQGKATAVNDLNAVRNRASLKDYSGSTDKASLLAAIQRERRIELFSEWGHRWFDLKRTGTIDPVMLTACIKKGGEWKSFQQLYPILYTEIQKNKNVMQNTGY